MSTPRVGHNTGAEPKRRPYVPAKQARAATAAKMREDNPGLRYRRAVESRWASMTPDERRCATEPMRRKRKKNAK